MTKISDDRGSVMTVTILCIYFIKLSMISHLNRSIVTRGMKRNPAIRHLINGKLEIMWRENVYEGIISGMKQPRSDNNAVCYMA